jgi:hypothetical protein
MHPSTFYLRCTCQVIVLSVLLLCHATAQEKEPLNGNPDAGKPSAATAVNQEVRETVEKFKSSIAVAIERLDKANKGTHEERLKELDALISDVKGALAEVRQGGKVFDKLSESIAVTDRMVAEIRGKMTDPSKTVETQTRYQALLRDADAQKTRLYQSQMAMHSARVMLEERVKLLEENKDLVVDYARLEQLEQANAAIMDVVLKMNSVTEELDKLVSGIAAPLP